VTGTRTDGEGSYIAAAKKYYAGPVVVGRDLMEF
jgi:hypothetical protein